MHSKTHFKSLFQSSKNSTVSAKNIFFLNTTHFIAQFLKLPNWRYKNHKTIQNLESNDLAFKYRVADRWDLLTEDPTCHRDKNRAGGATLLARPELADGEPTGGDIFTR